MARTSRVKKPVDACYHVISRIAGKRFLLSSPAVKREMVGILARVAEFSGVYVFAYCVMGFFGVCPQRILKITQRLSVESKEDSRAKICEARFW